MGDIMDKTIYSYHVPGMYFDHAIDFSPAKDKFSTHTHDMIEINYFITGKASFTVEGNVYRRKPDEILLLRPAETHMPIMDSPEPYERITVHISPGYLRQICTFDEELLKPFFERELGVFNRYDHSQFGSDHWKNCLLSISKSAKNSFDEKAYIDTNLIAFLTELNLAYTKRDLETEQAETDDLTIKIIQYINNNLSRPISVNGISEHFHISVTHMNRLFHKATGTSIWKYVTTKRLLAARLKIQSGKSAQAACFECGFNDYSTFYRAYKSRFSIAPKDDREIDN